MNLGKHWFYALALALALSVWLGAQDVYVAGLHSPTKVITIPNGNLLITEAGDTTNTGRVSLVAPGGTLRALIDGLPSGLSAPNMEADGPTGLALRGRVLYIAIGEGDSLRSGPLPRTLVPNPEGVSSPILSSVLKVRFEKDLDQYRSPLTFKAEDRFALSLGKTVTLKNDAGNSADFELLTNFSDAWPDPVSIYRNSHPFGLAIHPDVPARLFTVDAGMNILWVTNILTGRTKAFVQFPNIPNVGPGPPSREPVPDNVKACGDQLLVTLLSGAPFAPGYSSVMLVDPRTGETNSLLSGLNNATDVACATRPNGRPPAGGTVLNPASPPFSLFVLEISTNLGAVPPPPGRVVRYDGLVSRVFVDGLRQPTSLALDESTGTAYIVSRADGTILSAKYR